MKKLIINLFIFFVVFIGLFEIFLKVFGLATDVPFSHLFDNGYVLYKADQEGKFVRGSRGEVSTAFHINQTGWNSVVEYGAPDSSTLAIIGDSYIEGFYVDVDRSIGRKIELLTNNRYKVHEYGIAGANIHDYRVLFEDLKAKGYSDIFISIGTKDFFSKRSTFTGKSNMVSNILLRQVYNQLDLIRYLNVNLSIKKLWEGKLEKSKDVNIKELELKVNSLSPKGAIYLYDDIQFKDIITDLKMYEIVHKHQPKDYGFNGHWNELGALNVAETIIEYLNTK